jgi:hypothetical protein
MHRIFGLGLLVLASTACFDTGGDNVDPSPAENVIGTAAPLAHAGTLAMAILAGSPTSCAEVVAGCSTPPCAIEVGVSVGEGCHLPIGADAATGRVPVTGTLSTPDNGSLIAVFHDIDVDGDRVIFRRGAFTVTRNGRILNMAYGNQGLELTEPTVSVDQAGWTVAVDTGTTPGDTTDDRMEISGAQQLVNGANITQVALAGVVIDADCTLNPTAGTATMEKVGDSSGAVTTLRFHAACDGRADVAVSVGLDHIAVSDTVELRWFR